MPMSKCAYCGSNAPPDGTHRCLGCGSPRVVESEDDKPLSEYGELALNVFGFAGVLSLYSSRIAQEDAKKRAMYDAKMASARKTWIHNGMESCGQG